MKKILICSFNNISMDSRIKRYISSISGRYKIIVAGCEKSLQSFKNDFIFEDLHFYSKRKNKNIFEFINYNLFLKIKLYNLICRHKPDIIHCNDFETLLPAYLAFHNKPNKIIYDSHDLWTERIGVKRSLFHRLINYIDFLLERNITGKIFKTITVSDSIADFLSVKYRMVKPVIIKNISDESHTCESYADLSGQLFKSISGKLKFVYLGPISEERNLPMLIDSFIASHSKNSHLILIGKNYIRNYTSNESITFIDEIPEEVIPIYLEKCDIGVHPMRTDNSLNHKFALPNKLFQYMQAGLALLVFKNIETEKIINTHKNGYCIDFTDNNTIIQSINSIENSDVSRMKQNSLKAFKSSYSWNEGKIKYLNVLDSIK